MLPPRPSLLCSLLLALIFGGCDAVEDASGTFRASLSGAYALRLEGTAIAGPAVSDAGPSFDVELQDPGRGLIVLSRPTAEPLGEGVHEVGGLGGLTAIVQVADGRAFVAQSGTLIVTRATAAELDGDLDFVAVGAEGAATLRVQGVLRARVAGS